MARINIDNAPFIQKDFIVTTAFSQQHHALDLAPFGFSGDLYAIDHFKMQYKGYDNSYGNYAIFTNERGVMYLYAHMSQLPLKNVGDVYNIHEYVAPAGTTGTSTGVHLHLEMQSGITWNYQAPFSSYINPTSYLTGIMNVVNPDYVYYFDGTPAPTEEIKHKFPWYIFDSDPEILGGSIVE